VDHGEGDVSPLFDVYLGDPQVEASPGVGGGGAAGDDVKLGPLLGDDDVVDALPFCFCPP